MRKPLTTLLLLAGLAAAPAAAQTLRCPDLTTSRQVATCPSDEELKYTFVGFCSDNARLYDRKSEVCEDFERYRKLKNIALWESADGEFSGYASCDLEPEAIRAARPLRMTMERKSGLTRLVCEYAGGIRFDLRTRAACAVEGDGSCDSPQGCRASCK